MSCRLHQTMALPSCYFERSSKTATTATSTKIKIRDDAQPLYIRLDGKVPHRASYFLGQLKGPPFRTSTLCVTMHESWKSSVEALQALVPKIQAEGRVTPPTFCRSRRVLNALNPAT